MGNLDRLVVYAILCIPTVIYLQDEASMSVMVGTRPAQVRNIEMKDCTKTVRVALWRQCSEREVAVGDHIEVSHVTCRQCGVEKTLQTTQHSTIVVSC